MASHYMKLLGVQSVNEWEAVARSREVSLSDEEHQVRTQITAMFNHMRITDGKPVSEEFQRDQELLMTGKMNLDEFEAYLRTKYTREGHAND